MDLALCERIADVLFLRQKHALMPLRGHKAFVVSRISCGMSISSIKALLPESRMYQNAFFINIWLGFQQFLRYLPVEG